MNKQQKGDKNDQRPALEIDTLAEEEEEEEEGKDGWRMSGLLMPALIRRRHGMPYLPTGGSAAFALASQTIGKVQRASA